MELRIEWYAGYRGEETPRAFFIGDRRVEVEEVLDRWTEPDHRCFKIQGGDGVRYLLRHDVKKFQWEITRIVPRPPEDS